MLKNAKKRQKTHFGAVFEGDMVNLIFREFFFLNLVSEVSGYRHFKINSKTFDKVIYGSPGPPTCALALWRWPSCVWPLVFALWRYPFGSRLYQRSALPRQGGVIAAPLRGAFVAPALLPVFAGGPPPFGKRPSRCRHAGSPPSS